MDDYKDSIAACCKQLRLSVNLVENAMIQTGESHQEYLYHLLKEEIRYRRETRVAKLINTAGFPYSIALHPLIRARYSFLPMSLSKVSKHWISTIQAITL